MFELHISCSKDFDSLNIQFSDGSVGTFSGSEKPEKPEKVKVPEKIKKSENTEKAEKPERVEKVVKPSFKNSESFLNHFEKPNRSATSNLPEIPDITEVKVDPDLNDLEI